MRKDLIKFAEVPVLSKEKTINLFVKKEQKDALNAVFERASESEPRIPTRKNVVKKLEQF